jgi:hypothetical protein
MKLNVRKLDETIAKLQELRRLATDPTLAPFVTVTGRSTANGSTPRGANLAEAATSNGHRALKDAVLQACAELEGIFTIKDVFAVMQKKGTNPTSNSAEKSVGNYLRALVTEGLLKIEVQGSGRRATQYRIAQ